MPTFSDDCLRGLSWLALFLGILVHFDLGALNQCPFCIRDNFTYVLGDFFSFYTNKSADWRSWARERSCQKFLFCQATQIRWLCTVFRKHWGRKKLASKLTVLSLRHELRNAFLSETTDLTWLCVGLGMLQGVLRQMGRWAWESGCERISTESLKWFREDGARLPEKKVFRSNITLSALPEQNGVLAGGVLAPTDLWSYLIADIRTSQILSACLTTIFGISQPGKFSGSFEDSGIYQRDA